MVFPVNVITEHAQCMAGKPCRRQADEQASISQIKSYLTVTMIESFTLSGETEAVQRFYERAYKTQDDIPSST